MCGIYDNIFTRLTGRQTQSVKTGNGSNMKKDDQGPILISYWPENCHWATSPRHPEVSLSPAMNVINGCLGYKHTWFLTLHCNYRKQSHPCMTYVQYVCQSQFTGSPQPQPQQTINIPKNFKNWKQTVWYMARSKISFAILFAHLTYVSTLY